MLIKVPIPAQLSTDITDINFTSSLNKYLCVFIISLQVAKNRFDGELGIMLLKFDKETLSFCVKSAKD